MIANDNNGNRFWGLDSIAHVKSCFILGGGQHSTVVAFTLPDPTEPGSIPGVPEIFSEKKLSMFPRLIDSAAA